jgi:hypothetical protein
VNRAGAALRNATAELGANKAGELTQHPQQWRIARDVEAPELAVDIQLDHVVALRRLIDRS